MVDIQKPRILFVDDDPMLLASTRRQLLTKLNSYELVFCDSGKKALEAAHAKFPEIIFSDVRMPEMDGPELLKQFSERFPTTVRFALTGQSYEDQFDRTCAVTHQVFSKPFETEKIRLIVENLMYLRRTIGNTEIHSRLIRPLADFPDLGNVSDIVRKLNGPEMSIDKIVAAVEKDFTAKAHLLSIANSAFVAPVHPVTSVHGAIMLLGSSLTKAIFLAVQAKRIADKRACAQNALQSCLTYGVQLSLEIQKLALAERIDPDLRECAVMSGMLQRFGRILFTIHGDDSYCQLSQQAIKQEEEIAKIENEVFHISHEIVGAYVLLLWGMDSRVCLAIANLPTDSVEVTKLQELLASAKLKLAQRVA